MTDSDIEVRQFFNEVQLRINSAGKNRYGYLRLTPEDARALTEWLIEGDGERVLAGENGWVLTICKIDEERLSFTMQTSQGRCYKTSVWDGSSRLKLASRIAKAVSRIEIGLVTDTLL